MRTHTLTFIGHVMHTSTQARTHSQWSCDAHPRTRARTHIHRSLMHPHARARTHSQWSCDAHAHTRTGTHIHRSLMHPHARITHSQWSRDARTHTRTHKQTPKNTNSHIPRSSAQVHAHTMPRACALNVPEAYFYYYYDA